MCPRGIAPRRLDHLNILARDVLATRRFFHELLGLRLTEQIIFDDGDGDGRVAVGDQQVVRRRDHAAIAAARRDGCTTSPT